MVDFNKQVQYLCQPGTKILFDSIMEKVHQTIQLAEFVHDVSYNSLPADLIDQLKRHLLDAIGSLVHAQSADTIKKYAEYLRAIGSCGDINISGIGKISFDRAAQWYTALIRFPDFMDNFIGKEATCHPSDNIGPLLAAAQQERLGGEQFLLAMGLAYAIECTLVRKIPVMIRGFDHTTLYAYSVTAALCRLFGLSVQQTAHALGIAGCSFVPLVTSRASYTYEWKGLASSLVAQGCANVVMMARSGITGPLALFEGPKGFAEIMEMKLEHLWSPDDLNIIGRCVLKAFNAEVHTQSSLEAALELKKEQRFTATDIESIEITTFLTAYHIVGGGLYGDRTTVFSKEQADHSLPYVLAVALLDGQVYPQQFFAERILQPDVQQLLRKVKVKTVSPLHKPLPLAGILDPYTDAYPEKLKTKLVIRLTNGKEFNREKDDYHGFFTRPFNWHDTIDKFNRLTGDLITSERKEKIVELVQSLENRMIADLLPLCEPSGNIKIFSFH